VKLVADFEQATRSGRLCSEDWDREGAEKLFEPSIVSAETKGGFLCPRKMNKGETDSSNKE